MKITATTKRLRVDYREAGKFYSGSAPEGGVPQNTATHSDFAFDSKDVEIGESFDVPESTWTQVVAYEPTADHAEAPVAA